MDPEKEEKSALSRRELLVGAGKITAAGSLVVMAGGSLGLLAGCGDTSTTTTATSKVQSATLPWPYVKLETTDIKKIQETAHDNWFVGFCAFATLSGIVNLLREKVGEPYNSFPVEAITFAHGGTAGWGGTCGTLIGAGMAASLAAGPKVGEENTERCYELVQRDRIADLQAKQTESRDQVRQQERQSLMPPVGRKVDEERGCRFPQPAADGKMCTFIGGRCHKNSRISERQSRRQVCFGEQGALRGQRPAFTE
jgi:hypothetical protein